MEPDDKRFLLTVLGVVAVVLVPFLLLAVFVIGPSHDDRRNRCEAAGGVVISKGACIKKEYMIGY